MSKKHDDELDWKRLKAGRLDEGEANARRLSGGHRTGQAFVLSRTSIGGSTRPTKSVADAIHRINKHGQFKAEPSHQISTFHMNHSSISRRQKPNSNAGRNSARQTAIRFQDYLERAGEFKDQANSIEADEKGAITLGNIGSTRQERQEFWLASDAVERRTDARIQCRIIAELPHWIGAEHRRKIAEKFGAVFAEKKLGWFAAVHLPDIHGDSRNFHLHLVYSDRPYSRDPQSQEFIFSKKKDRSVQGPQWIKHLREQYAGIVNDVCLWQAAKKDVSPERVFFPGRSTDIGILNPPGRHLGAKKSAILRREPARVADVSSAKPQRSEALGTLIRKFSLYAKDIESLRELVDDGLHRKLLIHAHLWPNQKQLQKAIQEAVNSIDATNSILKKLDIAAPIVQLAEVSSPRYDYLKKRLEFLNLYFSEACSRVAHAKLVYDNLAGRVMTADLHDLEIATIKELARTDPQYRQLLADISSKGQTTFKNEPEKSQPVLTSISHRETEAKSIQPKTQGSNTPSTLDSLRALRTAAEAKEHLKSLTARDIELLSRSFSISLENERKLGARGRPKYCQWLTQWLELVSADQKRRTASMAKETTLPEPEKNRTSSRRGHER
jgi:hypothetical protein